MRRSLDRYLTRSKTVRINWYKKTSTKVILKDEDFKDLEAEFEARFKVDDANFPKIDESAGSDSDDSVVINKPPFGIRSSNYGQKEAYNYNSVDRYNIDDDDSDSDDDDDDIKTESDGEIKSDIREDNINRKRNSYLINKIDVENIEDIVNGIEAEEIACEKAVEEKDISTNNKILPIDEETELNTNIASDIMSPLNDKKQSFDSFSGNS